MKKFYVILAVLMMAMYGMFVSCTSEDEEYVYNHQYTYSPKEISEIQKIQAEYGVKLNLRTSSDKPLLSLKQIESLCQVVAMMQSTAKNGVMVDNNKMRFTSVRKRKSRIGVDSETYSGDYTSHYGDALYGIFEYEISWSDVNPTWGTGSIDINIISEPSVDGCYFEYSYSTKIVGGTCGIDYCITVKVYKSDSDEEIDSFDITGSC